MTQSTGQRQTPVAACLGMTSATLQQSVTRNSRCYYLEISLACAAVGTGPAFRHVFPACARRYAVVRHAQRFIVTERAQHALPFLRLGNGGWRRVGDRSIDTRKI